MRERTGPWRGVPTPEWLAAGLACPEQGRVSPAAISRQNHSNDVGTLIGTAPSSSMLKQGSTSSLRASAPARSFESQKRRNLLNVNAAEFMTGRNHCQPGHSAHDRHLGRIDAQTT